MDWRRSSCRPTGRDRQFGRRGAILASSASRRSCRRPGRARPWRGRDAFHDRTCRLQALLSRYSGQDDIAVGVPVANRNRPEIESLVGYFVNMLVIRTISRATRRSALCWGVFARRRGRVRAPGASFRQAGRGASAGPRPEPGAALRRHVRAPEQPDARLHPARADAGASRSRPGTGTAKFDLTLASRRGRDRLVGSLEYNTDLFDATTIDRMIDHFRIVLEAVVANPDTRLSEISLLGDTERALLLEQWHETAPPVAASSCVHELIEAQAKRTPGAIAVTHAGRALTYRELDDRSNRLARFLQSRGVRPEARVGLLIDRSIEMAVGILGILKSGGAFVPLDPSEPGPRLAAMVKAAELSIVLTRQSLRSHLTFSDVDLFCLDTDWNAISRLPDDQVAGGCRPGVRRLRDLHVGLDRNAARGDSRAPLGRQPQPGGGGLFGLGPGDRVLQFSPLHFDLAVEEIFPTWISGATLVLRENDDVLDPRRFTDWIEQERITVLDLPTAYWHAWVDWLSQRARVPGGRSDLSSWAARRHFPRLMRPGEAWSGTAFVG